MQWGWVNLTANAVLLTGHHGGEGGTSQYTKCESSGSDGDGLSERCRAANEGGTTESESREGGSVELRKKPRKGSTQGRREKRGKR